MKIDMKMHGARNRALLKGLTMAVIEGVGLPPPMNPSPGTREESVIEGVGLSPPMNPSPGTRVKSVMDIPRRAPQEGPLSDASR